MGRLRARKPRRAARAPAPRPARGPVAASPTGGSRPRAALGMLRRRPGRAVSERASAPPASATYLGALRPRMLQVWPGATPAGRVRGAGRPGSGVALAPPRLHPFPGARRTRGRAGGRRSPGVSAPRRGGEGAPPAALTWRGQAGATGRTGWGSLSGGAGTRPRRGVGVRSDPGWGGPRLAEPARPAAPEGPAAQRPWPPAAEGRTTRLEQATPGARSSQLRGRICLSAFKDGISWAWHELQRQ